MPLLPFSNAPTTDDVLEYANLASFPTTGEAGTIYVALDTNKVYRWSGSTYIEVSPMPDLSGYVPTTRTLTINGTGYDLSANRSWTIATGPSYGTTTQIPYMNAGGTDFLYSAGLTYDGTHLLSPSIIGSSADNGDITIQGTSSATKTTSYVNLQPTGGNVGIGTTTPRTKLELGNDGAILAIGATGTGWTEPNLGAGTRLLWYPRAGSFRAGTVTGTQWDAANIGSYSVAAGLNTKATGVGSFAVGNTSIASAHYANAMGENATAGGLYSLAVGYYNSTGGDSSLSVGSYTHATGKFSTAIGKYTTALSDNTFALGQGVDNSNHILNNIAGSLMVGFNSNIPTLFVGPSAGVGTTGNVGIGTTTPGEKLEVNGNIQLTADNNILKFGTGEDASITYDGTNWIFNPKVVGTGVMSVLGGMKIGDGGTTNYSEFETDGTLVFKGNATVFNDANVGSLVLVTGGTLPGVVEILNNAGAGTGIYTRGFAVGEQGSGSIEIPHDYKEGTNLLFHIHWMGQDAPTGTDNVKWQVTYTITRAEVTTPAVTTDSFETAFDTQYEWKFTDIETITGTNLKIGDQINFTVSRIASVGDAYGGEALVGTLGVHYECDTVGSRTISAK